QRELLHEDVRALRDGLVRGRRAVGPDLEDQAVVVRDLTDAGRLDGEVHLAHRAEERVDRDDPDRQALTALGGVEAAALLDGELHPERGLGLERRDRRLGRDELDLGGRGNVTSGGDAGTFLLERERDGLVRERTQPHVLQVEDDLYDVLLHARDGRELMRDAAHARGGDGRALERGQQHATQ